MKFVPNFDSTIIKLQKKEKPRFIRSDNVFGEPTPSRASVFCSYLTEVWSSAASPLWHQQGIFIHGTTADCKCSFFTINFDLYLIIVSWHYTFIFFSFSRLNLKLIKFTKSKVFGVFLPVRVVPQFPNIFCLTSNAKCVHVSNLLSLQTFNMFSYFHEKQGAWKLAASLAGCRLNEHI